MPALPGRKVVAVLEGTLIRAGEDRLRGSALRGTDRSTLLSASGLQYFATERLFLDLSVQVPLSEEVEREGLKSRWNALFQLRWTF